MDSPHFMLLAFLLLTVTAPHPNIAMTSDNHTEGTQDSSETNVTAYYCEGCESNICKSSDYEGFEIIGKRQNKKFSNKTIRLVIDETHITMCFQQEGAIPEGVYAIFWVRASGLGDSCGILNSGAFSENLNCSIIDVCCEAEINLSVPNRHLKCDIKRSKSISEITSKGNLGNLAFSIGEKSSITIPILIVLIGGFAAAMVVYYARKRRQRQEVGPERDNQAEREVSEEGAGEAAWSNHSPEASGEMAERALAALGDHWRDRILPATPGEAHTGAGVCS